MSQIGLLRSRRFWPLFWAQFLGAFNDNLLKNAAVILIVFEGLTVWGLPAAAMSTLAPALLMLPYIFFSGVAGQMADRFSKSWLVQRVKVAEIGIMLLAGAGFLYNVPHLLLLSILLLGLQATFFGPIKYSILPQLLNDEKELVTGNALVEMGTNIAILLGTICGGLLVDRAVIGNRGPWLVSESVLVIAILGYLSTRFLPRTESEAPDLKLDLNPVTTTLEIAAEGFKVRSIFLSLLGIGWFWLYGSALLALFLPYAKSVLHAGESVVTLFLALFSVGVAVGSILCEKLSFDRLELGLVPFGSIGMTLFAADLRFGWHAAPFDDGHLLSVMEFLHHPGGARIAIDMVLLAISSGFFIVPLYTFIQSRAEAAVRSRIIAVNNIISSLFIVAWAGVQIFLLHYMSVTVIFMLVAVLNAIVAVYIYTVIPEFFLRFVMYVITHVLYRVKTRGLTNIPHQGPAVLVCNHVSYVDWLIIFGSITRPVRFVMDYNIYNHFGIRKLLRDAKAIPIASAKTHPEVLQAAMDAVANELAQGELVCIFPEGMITRDGEVGTFKHGIEQIVERTPVPVVPLALRGLWGSFFSRKGGAPMSRPFRRLWSRVDLVGGPPISPQDVSADKLREIVLTLRGERL